MDAKACEYRRSELPGLDVTISARYHRSVARQLTPFPLRHRNLRNLTLQQECYLTNTQAFFRLCTALLDSLSASEQPFKTNTNRRRSIYQYSNMDLSLPGQTSIFGGVFFVFKSLLGIDRQN